MNIKHFLLLAVCSLPLFSFAQYGGRGGAPGGGGGPYESSSLSIFSENGELFFLVLNGVNQNNQPVSKVRVEGLPKYGNDIQIMFSDSRFAPIRKTVNIADPVDGKAVNMTLKIARGRDGYLRLKFHKCSEVEHNYRGPRDEYVMNYGNPQQINTTETTYTDPVTGRTVTETTTTTTRGGHYTPPPPPPPAGPQAMDPITFGQLKKTMENASFEDTKLSTAKTVLANNYVTTNQVIELCKMFSFEDRMLTLAKFAYSRTVDQSSYFRIADLFSFDASKNELNRFLSNGGR
jgi:hypothetical protein